MVPLGAVGEVTGVPAGPSVWQDGVHASSLHGLRQQFPESLFNPCEDLRGAYSFLFINQKAASETGSLIQDLRARLSDQGPLLSPHQAELTWVPSPGLKSRARGPISPSSCGIPSASRGCREPMTQRGAVCNGLGIGVR